MNNSIRLFFLFLMSIFAFSSYSQTKTKTIGASINDTTTHLLKTTANNSSTLGVYNWFENRSSATVLTFDDFSPGHPAIGIPYLINKNLTGTFFVTTNNAWRIDDYSIMQNAVNKGIEIGNHTVSHPNLKELAVNNPTSLNSEVNDAYKTINTNVTNQTVLTLAYPLGEFNTQVIDVVQQNHIAARTVFGPGSVGWPYQFAATENDYFLISTKAVNTSLSKANFAQTIEDGIADGGLVTFMFHSIYSPTVADQWFDAISEDYYSKLLDTLKHYSNQTWITTFSNAVRYHKEANSATIEIVSNTQDATIISLTDTLSNNTIYNQPLSLYYKPTVKSFYTRIEQNGTELPFSQTNGTITFNAIPDGGNIVLTKDPAQSDDPTLSLSDSNADKIIASIYPLPSSGTSTLTFSVKANDVYSYKLMDIQGRIIASTMSNRAGENLTVKEIISVQNKGFYLVEITINNHSKALKWVVE